MKKKINFLLFFLIFFSLYSQEEEITFEKKLNISSETKGEYWFWTKKDTAFKLSDHFEGKFRFLINYEQLYLRGGIFLYQPSLPKKPLREYYYNFEYSNPKVEFLLGNFYQTFGRGLTFRSYLNEDFRYDKVLFGAKAVFHILKSDITLFAGKMKSIIFQENRYQYENDTTDQLRGGEIIIYPFPFLEIGGRYVRLNKEKDITPQAFTEIFGPNFSFAYKFFDLYYEFCRKLSTREVIGGRKKGTGHYLAISFTFTGFGLTLEGMKYDSIDFGGEGYRYNDPPIPIKEGISINRGRDEKGFGISLNFTPFDFLNYDGSYGYLQNYKKEKFIQELINKINLKKNEDINNTFTFEYHQKKGVEIKVDLSRELKFVNETKLSFNDHTFGLEIPLSFVYDDNLKYNDYGIIFEYEYNPYFIFTIGYQKTTQKVAKYDFEDKWLLVEGTFFITQNIIWRIRIGKERGGLVCFGGVCRYEAPFSGIKTSLQIRL
ncbi:MAG: DUF6029 family protein [candidate division WOR-3 bacterium]|nr:DUF6029 family protein [candidate division WOR-3 bacterium]MDW8113503.1 DUF6029 family protein [candidate division WOR-3 bacterium]